MMMSFCHLQTAAFAVMHVWNGAKTMIFVDHILLGTENNDEGIWKILSKTFTHVHGLNKGERRRRAVWCVVVVVVATDPVMV